MGSKNGEDSSGRLVAHGSIVPFWTGKVEMPIRFNSCCFKTNEWPVVESYGRPIRFPVCGRCTQKLERGREMQMSQSQRGHAELSLSQNYKEAETESKGKPVGGRKVSDQKS